MVKWIACYVASYLLNDKTAFLHTLPNGNAISIAPITKESTDIRDQRGEKISIGFTADDKLVFSSNTSPELKELAYSMAKTTIGMRILKQMYSSAIRIVIEFDKTKVPFTNDGHYIGAQTTPIVSVKVDQNGRQKGLPYISSATIVIFEAGIKDMLSKNEGKVLIDGKTINLRLFSIPDIVASFAVHEGTHVLYREFSGALNPDATKAEIEKKPYENQLQHYRELLKKQR